MGRTPRCDFAHSLPSVDRPHSERPLPRTVPCAEKTDGSDAGLTTKQAMRTRWPALMAAAVMLVPLVSALVTTTLTARAGAGLTATIGAGGAIDVSDGSVDMVFDPAQEGGISQLYDLGSDPGRTVNLGPPAGFTVFDMYVNPAHGWGDIGGGAASVLEVLRNTPSSVVVHAMGAFMYTDGTGAVPGLQHETWTTIYPGGRVFIRRHLITGATPPNLYNFAGKSLDVSPASTWNAIFTGAASDTAYPGGTNTTAGNGGESWLGF